MTEKKETAPMTAAQARADAKKQADATKFIVARIKAAKARRLAGRPKPRVGNGAGD